ncbi:hypothetical protein SAMN05660976_00006 [Nonomuraea pusilla]|uniref:Uncharacterized protein n=1 Tax=Nonomuraea pusilla TaxID=46177 RepID=A0A1H7FDE5_9ACTN|nr:hypothetical protein SAMN05660976_00006 [Nonomuraea pusilla]
MSAACSFGKRPRALTARRIRALTDSMALAEQITRRISTSKWRKGTNSAQASSHDFTMAGYLPPHVSANSMNRSSAAASVGAVQTGLSPSATASQCRRAAYRKEERSR